MEIVSEGAEGKIYRENDKIIKERVPKSYRLEILDRKIRKFRTKREFKVIKKLYENNVNVPEPLKIDEKEMIIEIEELKGDTLKEVINKELLYRFFDEIIKIHQLDIVHGDLTSLNAIVKDDEVFIIDYGLASFSHKIEDKAEDLHLLFQNLKNEHGELLSHRDELESIYKKKASKAVIERVRRIEKRGRNK